RVPLSPIRGLKTNIGRSIVCSDADRDAILAVINGECSALMGTRKQPATEQTNEALVRVPPPDEYPGGHTCASRITDGDSVGHVFGRKSKPTWKPLWTQSFQAN